MVVVVEVVERKTTDRCRLAGCGLQGVEGQRLERTGGMCRWAGGGVGRDKGQAVRCRGARRDSQPSLTSGLGGRGGEGGNQAGQNGVWGGCASPSPQA